MVTMMAGGVAFEVEAVAFDKDGTLIDLDAAWGPAARAWVETAARGDVSLMAELAARMGLDLDRDHLVTGGLFAVGTLGQLHETTLQILEEKAIPDPGPVADAARHASARAGEEGRVVPLGDVVGTFRNLGRAGVKLAVVSSDDRSAIDDGIVLTIAQPKGMVESTRAAMKSVSEKLGGTDVILGFDCVLRRLDARNRQVFRDISELYRNNNVVGFGTYGEQYRSMHLNQTFTGIAFGHRRAAE